MSVKRCAKQKSLWVNSRLNTSSKFLTSHCNVKDQLFHLIGILILIIICNFYRSTIHVIMYFSFSNLSWLFMNNNFLYDESHATETLSVLGIPVRVTSKCNHSLMNGKFIDVLNLKIEHTNVPPNSIFIDFMNTIDQTD